MLIAFLILFFLRRSIISVDGKSFPVTPINVALEPRLDKFKATFAAPPNLISSADGLKTGTGASGETLSTLPEIYLSKMISPKTRTCPLFNILRTICANYIP